MDKVFIPVNLNNAHWCLAVIYMQTKRIEYYDSLGSSKYKEGFNKKRILCMEALKKYLADEYFKKKKEKLDTSTWVCTQPTTPQQNNKTDCGIFSIMCAHFLSTNLVRIHTIFRHLFMLINLNF